MIVRDLGSIISEYIGDGALGKGSKDIEMMNPADRLNKRLVFRSPEPEMGNLFLRTCRILKDFHSRIWMHDADSLIFQFKEAGFMNVNEMKCLQSQIEGSEGIENEENIPNEEGSCVEGLKPRSESGENVIYLESEGEKVE